MERIKWYLKQLLPLQYTSTHTEAGIRIKTVWRMWFGRCFDVELDTDMGDAIPASELSDLTASITTVAPLASKLGITEDDIIETIRFMTYNKNKFTAAAETGERLKSIYSSLIEPSEV